MGKPRQKAMHRKGQMKRFSKQSTLQNSFKKQSWQGLDLQSLTGANYRQLAKDSMNPDSLAEKLPTAKRAYPAVIVEQTRIKIREEKVEYSYIILKNGEGYKEALVYAKGQKGFWYCVYDCEQGSKVSEQSFHDRRLFQMEYDAGIVRMRYVKVKEPQFIIADCRV
jgi:hypothetical protein